jgi:hypothetical protein
LPSTLPSTAQKPRPITRRGIKEYFEGSGATISGLARESEALEAIRADKRDRLVAQQELKRRKLDHKLLEAQHQREREREQHEFRMLQMRLMIHDGRGAAATSGLGLLDELNSDIITAGSLAGGAGPSTLTPYSV